jgi:hypothetical protein
LAYFKVKNPKFEPFLKASKVLGGPQKQERKNNHNSTIFGTKKNKGEFFMRQAIKIFVVQ